ncbi:reverse transcriptase domain-containing protein [Tanacetum coccineum]
MTSPTRGGVLEGQDDREGTPPLTKEQIEGHISAMKSIIKEHNKRNKANPIRLNFEMEDQDPNEDRIVKGKEIDDEDLSKPFKETLKTPFTRRIIEFSGPEYNMPTNIALYDGSTDPADHLNRFVGAANSGEWPMPVWCRMFQKTLDGSARGWFESLSPNSINEWWRLREAFTTRYSTRKACYKEPHEITKIVRKANETLTAFKKRWTVETGFIIGVPDVMKISSFMDSVKSPELAKRFASNVPKTVNEMIKRLDEFVRAEEAYALTELPNPYKVRCSFNTGRHRDHGAPYHQRERTNRPVPVLSLDSLTKCPKEILATETQLQPPPPRPVANPLRMGDPDKYCDYHQDKGHHTNDCIQLRKQLEIALESGKLNHLMKDLRQRVERRQNRNPPVQKVINMVNVHSSKRKKQKDREATESWMNTPISFPSIMTDDTSDEPLIIEAEVEGYLVRRVYVDEGSSVEVMFEHCFENLPEKVKAGLRETRTDLVGFAGEVAKPLRKINLEVCFGNEGLSRRTLMKFIVIRAPSPYNIILGRPGLKILHAIPLTIHSMIKFPTPKGIATLIARTITIAECRFREEKQMIREVTPQEEEGVDITEQIIVNPCFPDQMVTIGGRLSKGCKEQLKLLLKGNMEVFAWEPADMTGVPRKVIEYALNVNPSLDPVCQKRRTFSPEKSGAVTKEVTEWIKAGIVRPVKYLTYISNPVLVKKCDGSWRMCIDFKNLNSACPKDYYPLPNIDCKEDEEKTAFYTDQGTYCYTKMPFGLKNAEATYQRLVDSTFQSQIGRNLEAYVDDMVIKSKEETSLLADIAETFEGLKTINMKLNPKKCSFGVEEGKFLGYMVTSEGI